MSGFTKVVVSVLFIMVFSAQNTFGYIDMGTGSYLVQLLIAGFLGVALTMKTFFKSLLGKILIKRPGIKSDKE